MLYFKCIHEKIISSTRTFGDQRRAGTFVCRVNVLVSIIVPDEHLQRGFILSNYAYTPSQRGQICCGFHRWDRRHGRRHHIDRDHPHPGAAQSLDAGTS